MDQRLLVDQIAAGLVGGCQGGRPARHGAVGREEGLPACQVHSIVQPDAVAPLERRQRGVQAGARALHIGHEPVGGALRFQVVESIEIDVEHACEGSIEVPVLGSRTQVQQVRHPSPRAIDVAGGRQFLHDRRDRPGRLGRLSGRDLQVRHARRWHFGRTPPDGIEYVARQHGDGPGVRLVVGRRHRGKGELGRGRPCQPRREQQQ